MSKMRTTTEDSPIFEAEVGGAQINAYETLDGPFVHLQLSQRPWHPMHPDDARELAKLLIEAADHIDPPKE